MHCLLWENQDQKVSNFSGVSIIMVWLLIIFLIYFKVAFNQAFLKYAGTLVTYAESLVSGIKFDPSDPDSPKVGNALFYSFTTAFKNLFKPLTILFYESYVPFHLISIYIIWMSGCIGFHTKCPWDHLDLFIRYQLHRMQITHQLKTKLTRPYSAFHSSSTKLPFSNCSKFIPLPNCSWYDIAYELYNTAGPIESAYE